MDANRATSDFWASTGDPGWGDTNLYDPSEDEMMADAGVVNCWVCDAIARPILDEDGNPTGGTDCGCDDYPE